MLVVCPCVCVETDTSKEVSILEATAELTNLSAARGITPTLVVRRPEDDGRPEVPSKMTLCSHLRGSRSSALVQDIDVKNVPEKK